MHRPQTPAGCDRGLLRYAVIGLCALMLFAGPASAKGGSAGSTGGGGRGHAAGSVSRGSFQGGAGPVGFGSERRTPGTYCQPGVCQSPTQR